MKIALVSLVLVLLASGPGFGLGQVTEASLSTDVVDRNPQGVANEFPSSVGRIYCFTRVTGMEKGEVIHRWVRDKKAETQVRLAVGGPSWRVWSAKSISLESVGSWKVEVVDAADGRILKVLEFTVKP